MGRGKSASRGRGVCTGEALPPDLNIWERAAAASPAPAQHQPPPTAPGRSSARGQPARHGGGIISARRPTRRPSSSWPPLCLVAPVGRERMLDSAGLRLRPSIARPIVGAHCPVSPPRPAQAACLAAPALKSAPLAREPHFFTRVVIHTLPPSKLKAGVNRPAMTPVDLGGVALGAAWWHPRYHWTAFVTARRSPAQPAGTLTASPHREMPHYTSKTSAYFLKNL